MHLSAQVIVVRPREVSRLVAGDAALRFNNDDDCWRVLRSQAVMSYLRS